MTGFGHGFRPFTAPTGGCRALFHRCERNERRFLPIPGDFRPVILKNRTLVKKSDRNPIDRIPSITILPLTVSRHITWQTQTYLSGTPAFAVRFVSRVRVLTVNAAVNRHDELVYEVTVGAWYRTLAPRVPGTDRHWFHWGCATKGIVA